MSNLGFSYQNRRPQPSPQNSHNPALPSVDAFRLTEPLLHGNDGHFPRENRPETKHTYSQLESVTPWGLDAFQRQNPIVGLPSPSLFKSLEALHVWLVVFFEVWYG
jgi:hypothetical protein